MSAAELEQLVITNRAGVVHRVGAKCLALHVAKQRMSVSSNQCLVYRLPNCDVCWPNVERYEAAIGRLRTRIIA